jgi:hypothetical protein
LWRWLGKRRAERERAAAQERERAAVQERKHAALEDRCRSLVGDAVTSVVYMEMEYDKPMWNRFEDYDSLDYGVELALRSGRTVALEWNSYEFGIWLAEGDVGVIEGTPRHDVSATSQWSSLIGRTITGCRVLWKPDYILDDRRNEIPQTIRLDFEGERRVLVTACEVHANSDPHWGADHVTVFFDHAWERRSDLTRGIHETLD